LSKKLFDLASIGSAVAQRRKERGLRQADLAARAEVSRATIDALENGRLAELGIRKVARILSVLGLELVIEKERTRRPTLEDLIRENEHDQGLGGRN
jgi:transcriptional regulator with XRE-family HTH domain